MFFSEIFEKGKENWLGQMHLFRSITMYVCPFFFPQKIPIILKFMLLHPLIFFPKFKLFCIDFFSWYIFL